MTNKITSVIYWPFEYISFACSYSQQWAEVSRVAHLCPMCVCVCVYVSVCVSTCLSSSFLKLALIKIYSLLYIYSLSPKFNKQSKTRASERKWKWCLMTLICWTLLSSPIARRAPVSVSPPLCCWASFVYWK